MGPNIFQHRRRPLPITIIGVVMLVSISFAVRACESEAEARPNNTTELNINGKVAAYMLCVIDYRTLDLERSEPVTDAIADGLTAGRDFSLSNPGAGPVVFTSAAGPVYS